MSGSRCRHGQEGGYHKAKARALTVSSGLSRGTSCGNGVKTWWQWCLGAARR